MGERGEGVSGTDSEWQRGGGELRARASRGELRTLIKVLIIIFLLGQLKKH